MVLRLVDRFIQITRNNGFATAISQTLHYLQLQATILKQTLFQPPFGESAVEKEILNSKMSLNIKESQVARQLAEHGIKERESTLAYRDLLAKLRSEHDRVYVFDIGANIGYFALLAANVLTSTGQVYAFEPGPNNINQLERNIKLNDYSQIDVHQAAIGAEPSTLELELISDSNIHRMADLTTDDTTNTMEVKVHALDDFVQARDLPAETPLIIRMDIEGYEGKAIEGMTRLLGSERPMYILVEIHPVDDDSRKAILDTLKKIGFEARFVSYDGGATITTNATFREVRCYDSNTHLLAQRI